jgi:hypothetical protein
MQQEAQARNNSDTPYSQQISMNDLIAFIAVIVQMGHDQEPRMKLYWTKNELYCGPFYSSVMSYDHFSKPWLTSHPNMECYWKYHFKFHPSAKWVFKSP